RSGINSSQIALVTFPGAMPELSIDPRHTGDKALRFDRAKNRTRLRIDLMNLPVAILSNPERSFGPRQPRVPAATRRSDCGDDASGLGVDFLDVRLGQLKQVRPVVRRSCMRGDVDRPQRLPAFRVQRGDRVSGSKPDVLSVIRDAVHTIDARKRTVFTHDFR